MIIVLLSLKVICILFPYTSKRGKVGYGSWKGNGWEGMEEREGKYSFIALLSSSGHY